MSPETTDNLHEKVMANELLLAVAAKSAASLDSFAGWMLAGFAASLALIIANIDNITALGLVASLRFAVVLLLVAAVLGLLQKYIAVSIIAAAEGASVGRAGSDRAIGQGIHIDVRWVLQEIDRAALPPFRRFVRRSFQKLEAGDFSVCGRTTARWAQVQGLLVLLEASVCLWAAGWLLFAVLSGGSGPTDPAAGSR